MKVKCLLGRNIMPRISEIWLKTFTAVIFQAVARARECYNYRETPSFKDCDQGCCGEDGEEHCCDATLQIVGCVLGGVVLISVIIGIGCYCYFKRSKRRRGGEEGPGLLARFGMRSNNNNTNTRQSQIPTIPSRGPPRIQTMGQPNLRNCQYNPQYIQSIQLAGPPPASYLYPGNTMYERPPLAPTAPMPPPYSMPGLAPPPYAPNKPVPPPPEYHTVVNHGYKLGDERERMPPPSS